jgi:hypothetical protein
MNRTGAQEMMWKPWRRGINMVESLFDAGINRINEMKCAGLTTSVCLHEMGHMLFAKLHNLTIEKAWVPPIDWLFDPSKSYPGVQIANVGGNEAKFCFYMGGLFGELSPYSDYDIRARWEDLFVMTWGTAGDLRGAVRTCPEPSVAEMIVRALHASNDAVERQALLRHFRFYELPAFEVFRAHRKQHMKLASAMYEQWGAVGFSRLDLAELIQG